MYHELMNCISHTLAVHGVEHTLHAGRIITINSGNEAYSSLRYPDSVRSGLFEGVHLPSKSKSFTPSRVLVLPLHLSIPHHGEPKRVASNPCTDERVIFPQSI